MLGLEKHQALFRAEKAHHSVDLGSKRTLETNEAENLARII